MERLPKFDEIMASSEILPLIDTHAHLDLDAFDADRSELIERSARGEFPTVRSRAVETGEKCLALVGLINPGITAESSRRAVELARRYPLIHPAVAVHPNDTADAGEEDWSEIERLAAEPSVVAIGETGLDRHWDDSPFPTQREWFRRHLDLAARRNLPVIIHSREADADLLETLRDVRREESRTAGAVPLRGVIHSFSSGPEVAAELIALGFYLGFTGSVTYPNKKFAPLHQAAALAPADRILLETDSPFLVPHPFRGKLERNEPLMTAFVAKRLAELRGVPSEEIVRQTARNAARLFGFDAA